MTKRFATTFLIAGALVPAAFVPAADAAKTRVAVGIGDQSPAMFADSNYRALKIKKVRYVVRWDAMKVPAARQAALDFVRAARRARSRIFFHVSTNDFTPKKAKLPSLRTYRRDVGRLVRYFRKKGVREWGVWNEANHKSQPTWRSPRRAAQYFRAMKRMCKGCTIVGLDVLDQAGVERYIRRWYSALPRSYRRSKVRVGIHNYSDTNRKRSSGTRSIIRTVKRRNRRATFWLTETGGVVNLSAKSFPCNERRAANRIGYMFTLARRFRRDIDRIYPYSWFGEDCDGFDAGIVSSAGVPRPGYHTFKSRARSFTR